MVKLEAEFKHYQANKADYMSKYAGKFIVLKGTTLLGVYDDRLKAIETTSHDHQLGTFLVQHVVDREERFRYHSRVNI